MSATLKSRLPLIAAELRPKVGAAVKATATLIAEEAAMRVPVGDPDIHLKDNMHVNRLGPAEYEVAAGGVGGDAPFYAHMVEFGTSHSAPQPFLVPAAEANWDEMVKLVAVALGDL